MRPDGDRVERRLAAILAADVAGYSRLMGADEEGTHERLKAHLRELIDPKIKEHRGHIVKNTGDGMLAEFASVVDAMRCAAEVQRGMIDREPEVIDERRINFRIGVNLGDIIAEEHDIFGDGVNVAVRLEALAEPGGICISQTVRDQIRDKLAYAFEDMGEQSLKNIARPVRVYALRREAVADLPASSAPGSPMISPPLALRLSIVVLPFTNLSDDREQQYFADGITDDLTTDLSRIADIFVISRNTAFTYRNKPVDTKQIGRDLGVRYVLEGSVRRSGSNQVRVNAQLIDAETSAHLWAERCDCAADDLLALQDKITRWIAAALNLELIGAAAARATEHPDALDYILRGRAAVSNPRSRGAYAEAINLFERALALDPRSVAAKSWLALTLASRVINHMTETTEADIARGEGLVGQALAASPRSSTVHFAKGEVLRAQRRYKEAIPEYETVLAFDRNSAWALIALGHCKLMIESIDEAIPLVEQAIRLSPRDPQIAVMYYRIGEMHLLRLSTDKAIAWLEKARSANPELSYVHAFLASAYALNGETEYAAAELAEARKLGGSDAYSSIAHLKAGYFGVPKIRALFEATYLVGLRKAGVPEG
jgi:TolB-like protein/class 3 adenylate cyclase/Flp pilus assembly protein TadD